MDIKVKRVYEPASPDDGYRVLVDRLWPRGIKKETLEMDRWAKELAPSTEARKAFAHKAENLPEFRARYTAELDASAEAGRAARELLSCGAQTLTLLYAAKDPQVNHAVILRDWLAAQEQPAAVASRERGRLTQLGAKGTVYRTDYDPTVLETFDNKHPERDYMVTFRCPEFTTLCPITGQPDFATLYINSSPNGRMVESKSLKLYLFSFRNHGDFHEDVVNIIRDDLVALMDPKYLEVRGMFYPRGGISIYPFANYAQPGSGYEEVARRRMFSQLSDLDSGDGAR